MDDDATAAVVGHATEPRTRCQCTTTTDGQISTSTAASTTAQSRDAPAEPAAAAATIAGTPRFEPNRLTRTDHFRNQGNRDEPIPSVRKAIRQAHPRRNDANLQQRQRSRANTRKINMSTSNDRHPPRIEAARHMRQMDHDRPL